MSWGNQFCCKLLVQDNRIPQSMSWDVVESKVLVVQTLVREGGRLHGAQVLCHGLVEVRLARHARMHVASPEQQPRPKAEGS